MQANLVHIANLFVDLFLPLLSLLHLYKIILMATKHVEVEEANQSLTR